MSAPMILAESEVERIIRLSRNAEFARAYLEKGIRVPTFPEILAEYSGVTDASALREKLCTRLQGMIGEPNAASIRRKVSVAKCPSGLRAKPRRKTAVSWCASCSRWT